jgi:hypothetical protein
MKAHHLALVLGFALAAQPLLAENAKERGHGGPPKGSASGKGRAESTYRPQTSGSDAPAGRSDNVALTGAQRRHPRPGPQSGYSPGRHSGSLGYRYYPYYRSYYYPYWGYSLYGYWGWPYGFYGYPYGYYGYHYPYPYAYGYRRDSGAIRVLVDPEGTRVYVDGYYAGVADDFDGVFQRLHVSPGRHEITLKLEGYRTHRVRVYVAADSTLKLRHEMVKGTGEETFEDLSGGGEEREGAYRDPGAAGLLRLDVQPEDASVYVDGQFWGTGRSGAEIELPPGRHRIEVVRPGFRTEEREVEIEPGRTARLGIDLQRP